MAAIGALTQLAKLKGLADDEFEDLDPELQDALSNPDVLRELVRNPGSKLVGVGSRLITAAALRTAWTSGIAAFFVLDFGLSLLYLNFHFFARHFAQRKGFTPFGSEWKIWRTVLGWPGFALKYVEVIALIFLDALVALIVLTALTLLALIVWAIVHPCEFISTIGYAQGAVLATLLAGPAAAGGVGACAVVNMVVK